MRTLRDQPQNVDHQLLRVGGRTVVVPSGSDAPVPPDLIPLQIDAGTAFGSGTHPTTRLCVAALERHLLPGDSVLDLGTGTGILAIVAAKLGASSALGLDVDPPSIEIARSNVAANAVGDRVRIQQGSLADALDGRYGSGAASLVVVNILANVILGFFEAGLTDVVAPGGTLILSGMLRSQTPDLIARLRWHALDELAREQADGWSCIIARRPLH